MEKLAKKNIRLLNLASAAILMELIISGVFLCVEAVVGITYEHSWISGVFIWIAVIAFNLIVYAVCLIKSRRLMKSDEWKNSYKAYEEKSKASIYGSVGAMAGGKMMREAGETAGNKVLSGAGGAAQAAGTAAAFGFALKDVSDRKKFSEQFVKKDNSKLRIRLAFAIIEILFMIACFIPAFIKIGNTYNDTVSVMMDAAQEIEDVFGKELYSAHTSTYEDIYATVYGYVDEEGDSYVSVQLDSTGTVTDINYMLSLNGYDAALINNELSDLINVIQEASTSPLAIDVSVTDEIMQEVSKGGSCKTTTEDGIEIRYIESTYSEGMFLITVEE